MAMAEAISMACVKLRRQRGVVIYGIILSQILVAVYRWHQYRPTVAASSGGKAEAVTQRQYERPSKIARGPSICSWRLQQLA